MSIETLRPLQGASSRLVWPHWTYRRMCAEHRRKPYIEQARTPVTDDETNTLDLFTHNDAARAAVAQRKKMAELTGAAAAAR